MDPTRLRLALLLFQMELHHVLTNGVDMDAPTDVLEERLFDVLQLLRRRGRGHGPRWIRRLRSVVGFFAADPYRPWSALRGFRLARGELGRETLEHTHVAHDLGVPDGGSHSIESIAGVEQQVAD